MATEKELQEGLKKDLAKNLEKEKAETGRSDKFDWDPSEITWVEKEIK